MSVQQILSFVRAGQITPAQAAMLLQLRGEIRMRRAWGPLRRWLARWWPRWL